MKKRKTTIRGGVFKDENGFWHNYFGESISGNHPTDKSAALNLKMKYDQAVEQFGDEWDVKLIRKDF